MEVSTFELSHHKLEVESHNLELLCWESDLGSCM